MESAPIRLMGEHEIRIRLGVGRRRIHEITKRRGFPEPVAVLGLGRVWAADDVESWIRTHRVDEAQVDKARVDEARVPV